MQRNEFLSGLLSIFKPRPAFTHFLDGLGNFEMEYPTGWKYDENIAVVDGNYTISFKSPDGHSTFTVAVNASLPAKFSLAGYVRAECGPTSGIVADAKKTKFHGLQAYKREYSFMCGNTRHFGGGMIFQSLEKAFSLSWDAPEKYRESMQKVFDHVMASFRAKRGFTIKKG